MSEGPEEQSPTPQPKGRDSFALLKGDLLEGIRAFLTKGRMQEPMLCIEDWTRQRGFPRLAGRVWLFGREPLTALRDLLNKALQENTESAD